MSNVEEALWVFDGDLVAVTALGLSANVGFVVAMAFGSVTGSVVGGLLLGVVAEAVLVPLLVALLLFSVVKVWRHA